MDSTRGRGLRFATAILTTALFLAAICTPPVASMLKINPHVPLQEGAPNPMPELRLDTIGQIIYTLRRNWLDRNFGLRKVLLRWEQLLDVRLLKSSMPTDPVLAGENGWLFLAQENPQLNVIADYRANNLLTPEQLDVWVKVFTARRDWLAARGIRYMVVVAANKASVYPEHIPARFNRVGDETKLDQMVKVLAGAGIDIVELRSALIEAKKNRLSYYRTDSHWTPYGAFYGYLEVAKRLGRHFPGLTPLSIDDYRVVEKPGLKGGLSYMLALGDLYPEHEVLLEPLVPRKAYDAGGQEAKLNHFQPLSVWENTDKSLPRAFVVRDSFIHEIIPFLAEHFSRVYFVWPFPTDAVHVRGFDTDAIEQEKPDIVIDEFVERYFTQPPPATALKDLPGEK